MTDPTVGRPEPHGVHPEPGEPGAPLRLAARAGVEIGGGRPIRKDEMVLEARGLYIESWLPERRSRRRPLYLIHGELGGSWLWERYLGYFAPRGWEAHALNLRAHFWSDTADVSQLTFESYVDDVRAGLARLGPRAVMIGHGLGALLALKAAETDECGGLVLLAPPLPRQLRAPIQPHRLREVPDVFRRDLVGWSGLPEQIRRANPDLSNDDVMRVQHLMGQESGAARRAMLAGIAVERSGLRDLPMLVVGAVLDRLFPEAGSERLARWLGAEYQPFGAHSHYGLVVGESSYRQVAEVIRSFLETHRL